MSKQVETEVRNDVERLLSMICSEPTNQDAYDFVLERLTTMVLTSVVPASGRPVRPCDADDTQDKHNFGEFSFNKEKFLAP